MVLTKNEIKQRIEIVFYAIFTWFVVIEVRSLIIERFSQFNSILLGAVGIVGTMILSKMWRNNR